MIQARWLVRQLELAREELEAVLPGASSEADKRALIRAMVRIQAVIVTLRGEQAAYVADVNDALYGQKEKR